MKTKLSRAILLASVALLSVVGAAVAFYSNRSLNSQLMASDVEALASREANSYYIIRHGECSITFAGCDRTYGAGNGVVSASTTFHSQSTNYNGEYYYCESATQWHYLISYYFSATECVVPGITQGWESYETLKCVSRVFD